MEGYLRPDANELTVLTKDNQEKSVPLKWIESIKLEKIKEGIPGADQLGGESYYSVRLQNSQEIFTLKKKYAFSLNTIAIIPDDRPSHLSFRKRKRYYHDFRWGIKAEKEEVIKAAKWIGDILKETHPKKCIFLIPLRGWSDPGKKGKEFYDPELIGLFEKWIKKWSGEDSVIEVDLSINDPQFGKMACEHLFHLMGS